MTNAREYLGPVRPNRGAHWDEACGNGPDAGRSDEWRDGFNHAMQTVALWLDFQTSRVQSNEGVVLGLAFGLSSIGMLKSNLLGRLMRGDDIRRIPCPVHQGKLQSFGADLSCCDGTGWLRNASEEAGAEPDKRGDTHWLTHSQREVWWRADTVGDRG